MQRPHSPLKISILRQSLPAHESADQIGTDVWQLAFALHQLTLSWRQGPKHHAAPSPSQPTDPGLIPSWDKNNSDLHWAGALIKHFKRLAPFQVAILDALQAQNWVTSVPIALPQQPGNAKQRLHNAAKRLTRNLAPYLWIGVEASGARVVWKPCLLPM
jgi:hypothetical protein